MMSFDHREECTNLDILRCAFNLHECGLQDLERPKALAQELLELLPHFQVRQRDVLPIRSQVLRRFLGLPTDDCYY